MGVVRTLTFVFVTAVSLCGYGAYSQDAPSLGDLARQQRQQKAQSKAAPSKDAKASKVITNDQLPGQADAATPTAAPGSPAASTASPDGTKQSIEDIKAQFVAQRNQVSSLQARIDEMNESIRFAPGNCVANCTQWNEAQKQKQREVEQMQTQLEEAKKHLQEMEDHARKQNYGSSVYDP
jgi:predicted RNase H-like nuclease (RuvC/YqgF family)